MRTFDLDFNAEIKLTWKDNIFWSNQKENETNKQKLKLRAPAQIILVYGFIDFIVKLKLAGCTYNTLFTLPCEIQNKNNVKKWKVKQCWKKMKEKTSQIEFNFEPDQGNNLETNAVNSDKSLRKGWFCNRKILCERS